MALTKSDFKEMRKVVSESVTDIVVDASQLILSGIQKMFDVRDIRFDVHDKKLDKLTKDIQSIKLDTRFIKDDIAGINGELGLKASKKDIIKLTQKVENYHPSN
ncbi:hypothetical protein IPM62_01465 [Candidatus Woesebacteria bacterium]|nr:MAG: hypothetical protein IPM62_01465 [Candidatus Woesebacteria bacterium]